MSAAEIIDLRELRRTLGCFATGVTIVTTLDSAGRPRGMTANSFTSVSLDPALILVCVAKSAPIMTVLDRTEGFVVNILEERQRDLSQRFATPGIDKFLGLTWHPGSSGAPILDSTLAHLDCSMHQRVDAGDHVILIGQVMDFARNDAAPLVFCRGNYAAIADPTMARAATPSQPSTAC